MFGFTIVLLNGQAHNKLPVGFQSKLRGKVWVKHNSNRVFEELKYIAEENNELIGFDGVVFNEAALFSRYQLNFNVQLVKAWSNNAIADKDIKGEFSCFYMDEHCLRIKANPNGTKPWFYAKTKHGVVVSNSLKEVTSLLKCFDETLVVNEQAATELLSYGFLIGNKTTFENVTKLRAGEQLNANANQVEVLASKRHNSISHNTNSLAENAEILSQLLTENIQDSYNYNKVRGYKQVATLSGGLDARLNVVLAKKLGFNVDETYSMGQSGHADVLIAEKISKSLNAKQHTFLLDDATHLKLLKENIKLNEGLVLYSGSAHLFAMFQDSQKAFGLIQSGQMGNVIGGGNVSQPVEVEPNLTGKAYNPKYICLTESWVNDELNHWKNEEVAKINERVFNGVNNGSWISEAYGYYTSPFLQANVIEFILSVPLSQKVNYTLYMELIKNHCPAMKQWAWDRTGLSPIGVWTLTYGKWRNRILKVWQQKVLRQSQKASMNPYKHWAKKHTWLNEFIATQWEENKQVIESHEQVFQIATDIMNNGSVLHKTQVLTLVAGLNYHLNE
jgi:asparagine synthase (glutamine-hydrolysing)